MSTITVVQYEEDFAAKADPSGWTWTQGTLPTSVFTHDYPSDVPPSTTVTNCFRMSQIAPATAYDNAMFNTGVLVTLDKAGAMIFWANYYDPNNTAGPIQINAIDQKGYGHGHNFYGEKWKTYSFYTPPGWTQYTIPLDAGPYKLKLADSRYGAIVVGSEFVGRMDFELAQLQFVTYEQTPDDGPLSARRAFLT